MSVPGARLTRTADAPGSRAPPGPRGRPADAMPEAYYVVWNGRCPGLYATWEACRAQVDGFPDAAFRKFTSPEAAARAWADGPGAAQDECPPRPASFVVGALAVDAACAGNPGPMEYRGVDLATREEVFHTGPMHGTNNLGEFLAIVHGLAWQHARACTAPIWSDSRTAIAWVRDRRIGCTLPRDARSGAGWALADRALRWLSAHHDHARVLKWPTAQWGEIPADFGRK